MNHIGSALCAHLALSETTGRCRVSDALAVQNASE